MPASKDDLRQALTTLLEGSERSRRLVIRAGAHWQVISATLNQPHLVHQSARSSRLPEAIKLNPSDARDMRALDFAKKAGGDWTRELSRSALDELPGEIFRIIRELHRVDGAIELELDIDDREHPTNPDLLATMRALADKGGRTAEARQAMYNEMVNTRFLLPFDPAAGPQADPEDAIERVEERNGRPVFAAFTDFESLRMWRPLHTDYMASHGSVLFEWLCEEKAAALLINPGGLVGGELFGHELEMLAEGVRRFVRKHGN